MSDRRVGATLGLRWFLRPDGGNRALRTRRIVAAACAAFVAVLGATVWQANDDRLDRGEGQLPTPGGLGGATFQVAQSNAPYDGDVWTTVLMGAGPAAPPPGLSAFPEPGTAYVSPAVERAIDDEPGLRDRVPGRVVGVIGQAGLQSPDQYFVYAGATPGPHWHPAHGWGSPGAAVARPVVPRLPLLGLVGILVGIPVLVLARATGRMSALSRQRSLAACHLLGFPVRLLSTATAVDAVLCVTAGAALGTAAAAAAVWLLHGTALVGLSWFAAPTLVSWPVVLVTWCGLALLTARDAVATTRRTLRDPLASRSGAPAGTRARTATPLVLGVAGLAGIVFADRVLGWMPPRSWTIVYMFVGGLLATVGALGGLAVVLGALSTRLARTRDLPVASFVAVRRLGWSRHAVAAGVIGITVVSLSSLVAAGVNADLAALSPPQPDGDRYAVQNVDDDQLPAALAVPGRARLLQVSDERQSLDVAECATLRTFVELVEPGRGDAFAEQCRPGEVFRIADRGTPGPGLVVLPGLPASALSDHPILAADPATAALPDGQRDIIVLPGPTDREVDAYFGRLLAAAPQADVTNLSADSFSPMVGPTQRLMVVCTVGGLLAASALLVLTAVDTHRRSRADGARLVALGSPRGLAARVHAITFGLGATAALGLGLLVGYLCATVYATAGGLTDGPGGTGVDLAVLAVGVSVLAVAVTWATARREHRDPLLEEINRE